MKNRIQFQRASIKCIMTRSARWSGSAASLLAGLLYAGSALAAPCFSVDGTKVTVNQLFSGDAKAQTIDFEDMPSVSQAVSRGSESHNMIFMSIKRDPAKKNVTSFLAKIDDKDYEFPKNACPKK